jgi:hypothetical protein|tara:strand:+ start:447 stop:965 length:519 start_codon:yes stop_codon:yes gene_type:complete
MNDIRTEYSLSGALALGSLYAGGSIIAAGSGGYNGTIPSSGTIAMSHFQGHSKPPTILDTQTVVIGSRSRGGNVSTGYKSTGYGNFGSITDGTSNVYSGAAINDIYHIDTDKLYFTLAGSRANSGWTTMKINGISFTRASASYSSSSSTTWIWSSVSSHPFGSSGTRAVTWE